MGTAGAIDGVATRDQRERRSLRFERAWIWTVVGYTVLRFVVAWGAFSDHGANVWIFGLLDVGTAWPYAKAIATICRRSAASQWRGLPVPIAVAVASFFAPYAYLWFAAGEMPAGLRAGLVVFVAVLALAAVFGVLSSTKKLRTESTPAAGDEHDPRSAEILIDLTTEPARLILPTAQPASESKRG